MTADKGRVVAPWVAAALMLAVQLLSLAYTYGDLNARVRALEDTDRRFESDVKCVQEIRADISWIKAMLRQQIEQRQGQERRP